MVLPVVLRLYNSRLVITGPSPTRELWQRRAGVCSGNLCAGLGRGCDVLKWVVEIACWSGSAVRERLLAMLC